MACLRGAVRTAAFFATGFLVTGFFATDFFFAVVFAAVFFVADFFATGFFAADFFVTDFFAADLALLRVFTFFPFFEAFADFADVALRAAPALAVFPVDFFAAEDFFATGLRAAVLEAVLAFVAAAFTERFFCAAVTVVAFFLAALPAARLRFEVAIIVTIVPRRSRVIA